jgi:hypothetical protein
MRYGWGILFCGVLLWGTVQFSHAETQEPTNTAGDNAATTAPSGEKKTGIALVQSHFERLREVGFNYTHPRPEEFDFTIGNDQRTFPAAVTVKEESNTVYMTAVIGKLVADSNKLGMISAELMAENYAANWTKVEWDKVTGNVRVSYVFIADDDLPFDEFSFIMDQMLTSAIIAQDILNKNR